MDVGRVYQSSTGGYFGDADVWERFESGAWKPCCWETTTGREWVETREGELLLLVPIPVFSLPDLTALRYDGDGIRVRERLQSAVE